jgi:signal transduction histidine kinase
MNIARQHAVATSAAIAAIAAIAAAVFWTVLEVRDAAVERLTTTAIARQITQLRLVTFDFVLHRNDRALDQWRLASTRLERLYSDQHAKDRDEAATYSDLRQRNVEAHRLVDLLGAADPGGGHDDEGPAPFTRFEAPLLAKLISDQQDSLVESFRLADLANERIERAQARLIAVIAAALALLASITVVGAWVIHRRVLAPIFEMGVVTRRIAGGDWNVRIGNGRRDEIGDLARHFDAMTGTLRASFERVERANRELAATNEELKAFSYSVSHDLRAPLRAIDGFSEMLHEDHSGELGGKGQALLGHIRAGCRQMGRLIDDLLRLSQVTRAAMNLAPVDVGAMAREIASDIEAAEPGRRVQWEIGSGLAARADAGLVRILLQNLLANAWKFSAGVPAPVIRVGVRRQGRLADFFVSDNGAGFDMAHAAGLFEPFRRLHRACEFPGTGIGLAIARRVITRHGGTIWAEAAPGAGATFFFTLGERAAPAGG